MLVSELIELLKTFPADAEIGKVSLDDDSGMSDSEMIAEDWGIAEDVEDAEGNPSNKKMVFCAFGSPEGLWDIEDEDEVIN